MSPQVDLRVVAARTAGFAGADLANLVNEAALLAARFDKPIVEMSDLESAIDRLVAGLEKKRVMSIKEREIVAYHESGHAIVATVVPGLDPVHKLSIVLRGFGALGYTMQLPLEERYLVTRTDLLGQLAVLLGGRTAEEIALGEISTGAQHDLQRATDIARSMVTEFGMSDALGAVNYESQKRSRFLDLPVMPERGVYAEVTAEKIDAEIKRLVSDAHEKAREILSSNRDKLENVARRLLEIEVMEGDELRQIVAALRRRLPRDTSSGGAFRSGPYRPADPPSDQLNAHDERNTGGPATRGPEDGGQRPAHAAARVIEHGIQADRQAAIMRRGRPHVAAGCRLRDKDA